MTQEPSPHRDAGAKSQKQEASVSTDPKSIEGLFIAALARDSDAERETFLNEACGDDQQRRRRVEALLRAYGAAGSFLEKPPAGASEPSEISLDFLIPCEDSNLLGMLGTHEIYEVLGRGGMGIVFRARDPKLNRVVAIKVLTPELAANANARRRFIREAQAAAAISHPHVVTIHAVEEGVRTPDPQGDNRLGLPYLVMECVVGQTLQEKLDQDGSLPVEEILRIGRQVAEGLGAAHKQGVIHRDIKPANILLENGVERVKITDFGLARVGDDMSITRTGEVSGTPQYMSPEQAQGEQVDQRSDLFSMGCVLYAMCTGRSPFRASTLAAAIHRVCHDTPRPIHEINPEIPDWLVTNINHLLWKDAQKRPKSATEVAERLSQHLAIRQQSRGASEPTTPAIPQETCDFPLPFASTIQAAKRAGKFVIWLGIFFLLTPVLLILSGPILGDGDIMQFGGTAALFGIPLGVLAILLGWINVLPPQSPIANALFLMLCVVLGPLGILLYLMRRDIECRRLDRPYSCPA